MDLNSESLSLRLCRKLADKYSFNEVDFSESRRMVSFRDKTQSVRINVYYSTGTIGTCLEHPNRGKTQLFRRNVSAGGLAAIFQNPRTHTGKGYYTRKGSGKWKKTVKNGGEGDSSRRWRYVLSASGLSADDAEIQSAVSFVKDWESHLWPDQMNVGNTKEAIGSCGSSCGISAMIFKLATKHDNVVASMSRSAMCDCEHCKDSDGPPFYVLEDIEQCEMIDEYRACHRKALKRFEERLLGFRKEIRHALMSWLYGTPGNLCRYELVTVDGTSLFDKLVSGAHQDYSELMYQGESRCWIHGSC